MMNVPALLRPYAKELDEKELTKFMTFYERFDPTYVEAIEKLVDYRERGIYVDVKEGKIITPSTFTKGEVEGFLMDALIFVKLMEIILEGYESADEETRKSMLDSIKEGIHVGIINFNRMYKERKK